MTKLMDNRFALTIVILFVSHTLFPAHVTRPKGLCVEDKSSHQLQSRKRHKMHDYESQSSKRYKMHDHEQLTVELQQLVDKTKDDTFATNSPIMQELIRNGASANVKKHDHLSLISYACLMDDLRLAEACVTHGACLENTDMIGRASLSFCESVPLIALLLGAKADPNHEDNFEKIALSNATTHDYSVRVIEELCRHSVPSHNRRKSTPLHSLCVMGKDESDFWQKLVALFWWSPSQLDVMDSQGRLPLYYLEPDNSDLISTLDAINRDVTRALTFLSLFQEKEIEVIIETFVPVGSVAKLVSGYSGLPYISLRNFMAREGAAREYPAIAQALSVP